MIPDYQSIFLPLLEYLGDDQPKKIRDIINGLANQFELTEEELDSLLPSGNAPIFDNRVHWARTYLAKAGLLYNPSRGIVRITDEGKSVLKQKLPGIDNRFLKQYKTFVDFQTVKKKEETIESPKASESVSPDERMEEAYLEISNVLERKLLEAVLEMSPTFFEKLVVDLLVKMGYGGTVNAAGRATQRTADEGIDGIIKQDKLGLDIIYLQAKRWQPGNVVGRPELQKFVGALAGKGAKKGVFITTSNYSKEALDYTAYNETKIVLIDGIKLSRLMLEYNLGCSVSKSFEIKKIDLDYFEED